MLTELQREMIKSITDISTCKNNPKYINMTNYIHVCTVCYRDTAKGTLQT